MQAMPSSFDARWVSIPCVLVASTLQYIRFAKKPMAAPFHRVTERGARRLLVVGLVAELVALRLLPLMQAYPMNASCLVFLYFWKESKRAKVLQMNEVLACILALVVWILPCLDPGGGRVEEMQADVLGTLLSPGSCAYVASLLLVGIVVSLCYRGGNNAFVSCLPSALNFGVSSMLLKAIPQVAASLFRAPQRLELWAALPVMVVLIFSVRSAAASPLRKALEVHDSLSVLAAYGVLSGVAAAVTGGFIYGELVGWIPERQAIYAALLAAHCWGMHSLSSGETRGSPAPQKAKSENEGAGRRHVVDSGGDKAAGAGNGRQSIEMGRPTAPPDHAPAATVTAEDKGPLLNFEEGAGRRRSVEDDARMEEQLFAMAFRSADGEVVADGGIAEPQFEADFEELMRRFDEDDRAQPITELALEQVEDSASPASAPVLPDATPVHSVLALDAQALLDSNANEDEDELLKGIEDIE